jgi:endoglucanase
MSLYKILSISLLLTIIFSCHKKEDEGAQPTTSTHVHTNGTDILDANGNKLYLRGVAFGNEVWTDVEIPSTHHAEVDYGRVHDMGMNAIRFYMNYKTFEDDANPYVYKTSGWDWIDQNITWAKNHNVYLILNMHVPQGGFQSNGNGGALWNNPENQARLKALWFNIAKRYANEPVIAGFDLLNEPVVTTSIDQWKNFAQDIIDTIRTVNKTHMIIVERVNAVGTNWSSNAEMNFFELDDNNLAYEFHFYTPMEFTHQGADWITNPPIPQGQVYPDPNKLYVTGTTSFLTASFSNPKIAAGTYDWTEYVESPKFKINDAKIKLCQPSVVNRANTGKIWVDDMVVKEYDENNNFVRTVWNIDITSYDGWYYWSQDGSGSAGTDLTTGHSNSNSVYMQGSASDANLSNSKYQFIPKQGYSYTIGGWVKGEDVTVGSAAMFRLDCNQISAGGAVYSFGKEYLASQVDQYYQWTKAHNRPLFLGEFGAIQYAFINDRGGIQWVNDMIDILKEREAHFTYHDYHEDNFGLYKGYGSAVDPAQCNQPLIDLFKSKLP